MERFFLEGPGLHSGAPARLEARPRPDAPGMIAVVAASGRRWELGAAAVAESGGALCTSLGGAGGLRTLEHALAALVGLGRGGVELALTRGEELPGAGGDSAAWLELLAPATSSALPRWSPPTTLEVRQGTSWARWSPGEPELEVRALIDFPGTVIGRQRLALTVDPATFAASLAPARTFATAQSLEQAAALQAAGVGRGLGPGEALVAGPEGWLWGTPRWPDEPVRHKILDLLGDLGLLGVRPAGLIEVERGGHRLHRALARAAAAHLPAGPRVSPAGGARST